MTTLKTPVLAVAALCLVVACGEPPPPEHCGVPEGAPLRQETYRPLGLYLADNPNLAKPGHMQRAANAVMRDDFLEPARGFAQDVDPGTTVDAMYPWRIGDELHLIFRGTDNTLYRRKVQTGASLSRTGSTVTVTLTAHGFSVGNRVTVVESSNGTLFPPAAFTVATVPGANSFTFTSAGTAGSATAGVIASPVAYSGTYIPPTGHPMRFWEAGGSLFFTTSEGPFRLDSPTATPVLAGAPPGLEGKVAPTNTDGAWLNYGETVGYRYTWAKSTATDPERLLEGAPSGRMLLTNLVQDATPIAFTWTRAAAVITATDVAHGLATSDSIVVTTSSDTTAIPLGVYTITVGSPDTFTFTGVDAGGASGTGEYVGDDDGVRNVLCTPYIPDGVVQGEDYCKVHRTVITTTGGVDPGEDYALVAERYPTTADIAARTTTVEDIAPFANGEESYFSASVGGVANAFDRPPLITDAIAFQDYILGVAPLQRRAIPLALLAIDGTDGLGSFDGIKLTNDGNSEIYLAGLPVDEGVATGGGRIFGKYNTGTVSGNLENTVRSLVRVINLYSSYWYASYTSGDTDPPGRLVIVERELFAADSTIRAFRNHLAFSPTMRVDMRGNFTRAGTTVSVDTFTPSGSFHHLVAGDTILLEAGDINFPDGVKTVTNVPSASVFEYTEAGPAVGGPGTTLDFSNNTGDIELESVLLQNSWVYSAAQQWEAFPPSSQVTLGGPTSELFRFEQFGTVGLFFNNEALWRLTGKDPTEFDVRPFPGGGETVRLFAQNTVAKTPAGVFALAEEGALLATDVQFNPTVSEPIKPIIQKFVAGSEALKAATKTYAWALGNEHEREYWLFLPDETASSPSTTTQAYVYSAKAAEKGGTGWTGPYTTGARTGTYSRADQRMYLAPNTSGPLLRERRDNAASDFRNPTYTGGVPFEVEMVPFRGSSQDIDKQWVKAIVSPENTAANPMPAYLGMDFSTSNNEHGTWYPDGPHQHIAYNGTYQTGIPEETCRGKELGIRLSHSTASEWLRVTGITLWFNQAAR